MTTEHRSGISGSGRALLAAASAVLALNLATAVPATADPPSRVALPSPNPSSLTGTVKALDPTQQLTLRVYLAPRPGLANAAAAVSNPRGPGYAHYLTPATAQQRYAPTTAQAAVVSAWLTAQGMTITATTQHYIAVTATVAQADAAFATQVSEYDSTVTEFKRTFNIRNPGVAGGFSIPGALAGDILSVTGIEQTTLPNTTATPKKVQAATRSSHPVQATASTFQCSQYWGQYTGQIPTAYGHTTAPTQLCGYTPDQMRHAYGLTNSPYTGKGVTIAVILNGYSPTELADSNQFFANHGEPRFTAGQFTENLGPNVDSTCAANQDPQGDPLEESIDVQSAHLAAPDANVVYVAADCAVTGGDLTATWLDGATRVVDQHLADVATGSWGIPEQFLSPADMAPWDQIFQQGALEGIGFDFSSGDGGDVVGDVNDPNAYNVHNVQFPATDPWITAVGGTSLNIGQDGSVVADYPWGDDTAAITPAGTGYTQAPPGTFQSGSGGGISTMFTEPGYQKSAVPPSLATDNGTGPASRVIPDISADAGNVWLIGYTGAVTDGMYGELPEGGGTSGSSPLIAGLEADAIQAAGHPLGFVNPLLYCLGDSKAIRDILPVNPADPPIALGQQLSTEIDPNQLTTFGEDATIKATPGYDDVTGLGAPTASFITALAKR